MNQTERQEWEIEFDEKFEQRNDCSNFYNRHRSDCQGCVKIIVEEPEQMKSFIREELARSKKALLTRVEKEVIGEDDEYGVADDQGKMVIDCLNGLRIEERQRLANLKEEI